MLYLIFKVCHSALIKKKVKEYIKQLKKTHIIWKSYCLYFTLNDCERRIMIWSRVQIFWYSLKRHIMWKGFCHILRYWCFHIFQAELINALQKCYCFSFEDDLSIKIIAFWANIFLKIQQETLFSESKESIWPIMSDGGYCVCICICISLCICICISKKNI